MFQFKQIISCVLAFSFVLNAAAADKGSRGSKVWSASVNEIFHSQLEDFVSNIEEKVSKASKADPRAALLPGKIANGSCSAKILKKNTVAFTCDSKSVVVEFLPAKKMVRVGDETYSFEEAKAASFHERLHGNLSIETVSLSGKILNLFFMPSARAEVVVAIIFGTLTISLLIDGFMYYFGGSDCGDQAQDLIDSGKKWHAQCRQDTNEVLSTAVEKKNTKTYKNFEEFTHDSPREFSCARLIENNLKKCADDEDFINKKEEFCAAFESAEICVNDFFAIDDESVSNQEIEEGSSEDSPDGSDGNGSGASAIQE